MNSHAAATAPLFIAFANLPDPRKRRNRHYPLIDIISVVILGILTDADDFVGAYQWAHYHRNWLASIGLCLNGVPSHDTMNRVFRYLKPEAFNECFMDWVRTICATVEGVIAIDGKTLRNSGDAFHKTNPLHIVHAFAAEKQLLLGQFATAAKSNEITAIPELLKMLAIRGNIITIDAMGCQKAITHQIVEQEGDYLIALKGNQGTLHAEVENFFLQAMEVEPVESECDMFMSLEKNKARVEERRVWSCCADWLDSELTKDWAGLKSLACIQSIRTHKGKTTTEIRYYITSLPSEAKRLAEIAREHWGVENKLHWHLDVSFGEDGSNIRMDHAAENFSLARKMALNLLRADTSKKVGIPNKRKAASWNHDYLLQVLGVK